MILSSVDAAAMAKISGDDALRYVVANEWETSVLRWMIGGNNLLAEDLGMTEQALSTRLMRIWDACTTYDLGKWCRSWIADACSYRARDVLEALTNPETGEKPKASFIRETEVMS